jgi:hypothetical protein
MLENIIVLLIVVAVVAGAVAKIIVDKKSGVKCSGCPHSKVCASKNVCPSQKLPEKLSK